MYTLAPYCHACNRARQREVFADPRRRAVKRDRDRAYREAQRRAAGIAPRVWSAPPVVVSPGSARERVPNAALAAAFVASGLSGGVLARRLGFMRRNMQRGKVVTGPDATYVLRLLGLKAETKSGRCSKTIQYHNAVRIIRALDLDPVDFGV